MIFKMFTGGLFKTNCYVIGDEEQGICCLIDCVHGAFDAISQFVDEKDLKLETVILTHSHFDHIGDLKRVHEKFSPRILVHHKDRKNLSLPGSDGIPLFVPTEGVEADQMIGESDVLRVGSIQMNVIDTPGHSPGSVSLYLPNEKIVFSGDLIFRRGRGRTDLPGCNEADLFQSIEKIIGLGDDVVIYSGHGKKTTVGEERRHYS